MQSIRALETKEVSEKVMKAKFIHKVRVSSLLTPVKHNKNLYISHCSLNLTRRPLFSRTIILSYFLSLTTLMQTFSFTRSLQMPLERVH
jgi:hypothetical protein